MKEKFTKLFEKLDDKGKARLNGCTSRFASDAVKILPNQRNNNRISHFHFQAFLRYRLGLKVINESNRACIAGCKKDQKSIIVDQFGDHALKCVKGKDSIHARHNEMVNEICDLSTRLGFGVTKEVKEKCVDTKERPADLAYVCGIGGKRQDTDFTLTSALCKSNILSLQNDKNSLTSSAEKAKRKKYSEYTIL